MEPWSNLIHAVSQRCTYKLLHHRLASRKKNTRKKETVALRDIMSQNPVSYLSRLSGLSPFLGDDDNETLNNILACQWNFEEEEFRDISDEAKDFITRLLVKSKSWRMSATESLRHAWLSDRNLHYQLHQKVKSSFCWPTTVDQLIKKENLQRPIAFVNVW